MLSDDAKKIESVIEKAGETLYCLTVHGTKPAGYRNYWPAIKHSWEDYAAQEPEMRYPQPTPKEITEMDHWLDRVRAQPSVQARTVVQLRMIKNPMRDRPSLSWHKIGEKMGCSHTKCISDYNKFLESTAAYEKYHGRL